MDGVKISSVCITLDAINGGSFVKGRTAKKDSCRDTTVRPLTFPAALPVRRISSKSAMAERILQKTYREDVSRVVSWAAVSPFGCFPSCIHTTISFFNDVA